MSYERCKMCDFYETMPEALRPHCIGEETHEQKSTNPYKSKSIHYEEDKMLGYTRENVNKGSTAYEPILSSLEAKAVIPTATAGSASNSYLPNTLWKQEQRFSASDDDSGNSGMTHTRSQSMSSFPSTTSSASRSTGKIEQTEKKEYHTQQNNKQALWTYTAKQDHKHDPNAYGMASITTTATNVSTQNDSVEGLFAQIKKAKGNLRDALLPQKDEFGMLEQHAFTKAIRK